MNFYGNPIVRQHPNGSVSHTTDHPFASLGKVSNCPIVDTELRLTARTNGYPDTFFSIPAEITYKKKHIRGFLTIHSEDSKEGEGYCFIPYQYTKNYKLLKP